MIFSDDFILQYLFLSLHSNQSDILSRNGFEKGLFCFQFMLLNFTNKSSIRSKWDPHTHTQSGQIFFDVEFDVIRIILN